MLTLLGGTITNRRLTSAHRLLIEVEHTRCPSTASRQNETVVNLLGRPSLRLGKRIYTVHEAAKQHAA